jgi:hypothetical protein
LSRIGDGIFRLTLDPGRKPTVKRLDLLGRHGELEPVIVEFVEPRRMVHELFELDPVASARHVQVDVPVAACEERRRALLVVVVAGVLRRDLARDEPAQYAVGARNQHRLCR